MVYELGRWEGPKEPILLVHTQDWNTTKTLLTATTAQTKMASTMIRVFCLRTNGWQQRSLQKKQAMLDMRADYVIAPEFYGSNFLVDWRIERRTDVPFFGDDHLDHNQVSDTQWTLISLCWHEHANSNDWLQMETCCCIRALWHEKTIQNQQASNPKCALWCLGGGESAHGHPAK